MRITFQMQFEVFIGTRQRRTRVEGTVSKQFSATTRTVVNPRPTGVFL